MPLKAAFMFIAEGADSTTHRSQVNTPSVHLTSIAVSNYQEAASVAKQLVEEGIVAIELCGGFGIEGTALIKQAVPKHIVIGVVRFDGHPGFGNKSGDELF